jgi:hypothetical protein
MAHSQPHTRTLHGAARAANPAPKGTIAKAGEEKYSLGSWLRTLNRRYAEMNGTNRMYESTSVLTE